MYIHVSITSYASKIISCQEYTNKDKDMRNVMPTLATIT